MSREKGVRVSGQIVSDEIDLNISENLNRLKSQVSLRRLEFKSEINHKIDEYSNLLNQKIEYLISDFQDKLNLGYTQDKLNEILSELRSVHIEPGVLSLIDIEKCLGRITTSISFILRSTSSYSISG